jgi:hypothetical protein
METSVVVMNGDDGVAMMMMVVHGDDGDAGDAW